VSPQVRRQRRQTYSLEAGIKAGAVARRRFRQPVEGLGQQLVGRPLERPAAGQHPVEHDAQAVNVAGGAQRLGVAVDLFRRQVRQRANHHPGSGHPRVRGSAPAGQAEVHHHRFPALVHHHVGRLQVPVDDPRLVGHVQRPRHQGGEVGRRRLGQAPFFLQPGQQGSSGKQRHRQVVNAVDLAHVVDRAQVGVGEGGRDPGLAVEALERLGVGARAEAGDLEGHLPVELGVVGQVNPAHAALPQHPKYPVAP
jgi:hypothetical protein